MNASFRTIYLMSHYLFLLCFFFITLNWRVYVCTYSAVRFNDPDPLSGIS